MRNAPMRWIEQAERRQVVTHALFERAPKAPWSDAAADTAAQWLPRLGAWLAGRYPMGLPTPQLQPVLVRQPARRAERHADDGYSRRR